MTETWEYHLTASELKRLLVQAMCWGVSVKQGTVDKKYVKGIAAATLNDLAQTAHFRRTTHEEINVGEYQPIVEFRDFPSLQRGAGDGNRTRIASLEGARTGKMHEA